MLLEDIIKLATDDKSSLASLLRNCQVLAHKLKNGKLKDWTSKELNGYGGRRDLPNYRILNAPAVGKFSNFRGDLVERNIPSSVLEQKHRVWAEKVYLAHSVTTLEHVRTTANKVTFPWENNLILHYQNELIKGEGWTLVEAYQKVMLSDIVGVLDTIRNRVLEMALEIQTDVGSADAELSKAASNAQEAENLDRKVTNIIFGKTVVFAPGSSNVHTSTSEQNIVAGDWESLKQALVGAGIQEPEVEALSTAVKHDGERAGSSVQSWIAKNAPKVMVNGIKMGAEVGKSILTEWLLRHYQLKQ